MINERLRGAAHIISQRDYPNYDPDYEFTAEVAAALDEWDKVHSIRRVSFDQVGVEKIRRVLAKGAYQMSAKELPYEAQARAVLQSLMEGA